MVSRDIVVVGGSTGGLDALKPFVRGLPPDLEASVLVVLHVMPNWPTRVPEIMEGFGPLPAGHGVDGEPLRRGRIYFAPPDRHMAIEGERLRVFEGPKENWSRPSIDTLFRSAAVSHGPRVIGVVLSGTLYDGATGASAIRRTGGKLIVQDIPEGPRSALPASTRNATSVDAVLPAEEIAGQVTRWVREPLEAGGAFDVPEKIRIENEIMLGSQEERLSKLEQIGALTMLTCPQCHGSLWQIEDPSLVRYRCHVGHAFSAESLDAGQRDSIENALWSAARELEERVVSTRGLAQLARYRKDEGQARAFEERSRLAEEHARILSRFAAHVSRSLRPGGAWSPEESTGTG